jgi:hypothetical protein
MLQEIALRMCYFLGQIGGNNKYVLLPIQDASAPAVAMQPETKFMSGFTVSSAYSQSQTVSLAAFNSVKASLMSQALEASMKWDTQNVISFDLTFVKNKRLQLSIDPLLPRLVALAENSPDRRIKLAACESLHSIIILTVAQRAKAHSGGSSNSAAGQVGGLAAVDSGTEGGADVYKSPDKLYKKLFPCIVRLACDDDVTVKTIFSELGTLSSRINLSHFVISMFSFKNHLHRSNSFVKLLKQL